MIRGIRRVSVCRSPNVGIRRRAARATCAPHGGSLPGRASRRQTPAASLNLHHFRDPAMVFPDREHEVLPTAARALDAGAGGNARERAAAAQQGLRMSAHAYPGGVVAGRDGARSPSADQLDSHDVLRLRYFRWHLAIFRRVARVMPGDENCTPGRPKTSTGVARCRGRGPMFRPGRPRPGSPPRAPHSCRFFERPPRVLLGQSDLRMVR